ncbi:LuxR C-terminal-related transcriptional regulator [Streptomyces sp. NPDC005925]|uniref:LuxR C-terminal-related transcriptional regulator n=1 Tax=Streptomyces sp. NPDC005925 TaxID=3157172 RepID=UPI003406935C
MLKRDLADQSHDAPGDKHSCAVYVALLSAQGSTLAELHEKTGLPPSVFTAAMERLHRLGLVEGDPSADGRLLAVPPAAAMIRTCGDDLQSLAEKQERVYRVTASLSPFTRVYREVPGGDGMATSGRRLLNRGAVGETLCELTAGTRGEILTSLPTGDPEEFLTSTENALRRGVRLRALYQSSAQFNRASAQGAQRLIRLGAEVRLIEDGFMKIVVFDRSTAVLPRGDGTEGALVVQDPSIVDFAVNAYSRAWAEGSAFPTQYRRQQVLEASDRTKRVIMKLLAEGAEVASIAKRLGISPRTCQRHISEIMHRLGARNRFHAGYLMSQRGLVD